MKKLKRILIFILMLMLMLSTPITVFAEVGANGDSDDDGPATRKIVGGPSSAKQFWLVYITDEGGALKSSVVMLHSQGMSHNAEYIKTRPEHGSAAPSKTMVGSDFGWSFDSSGHGRGTEIKNYLKENDDSGQPRAITLIEELWGTEKAKEWVSEEEYLVLENGIWASVYKNRQHTGITLAATSYGWGLVQNSLGINPKGDPLINRYTNSMLPNSSKLQFTQTGVQAPIHSGKVDNADMINYGHGMLILWAGELDAQTTCDESLDPEPHQAPDESYVKNGWNIVKNYRTHNLTTDEYTDDGCFIKKEVTNEILIEEESEYHVIGWKTSTTLSSIDSIDWPVPAAVHQSGTTPKKIKMKEPETTLYVLLEKVEEEEEVAEEEYNYLLTQSMITRTIWENFPDNEDGMELLMDAEFTWTSPEHPEVCEHSHTCEEPCDTYKYDTDNDGVDEDVPYCPGHTISHDFDKWHEHEIKFSLYNTAKNDYPDILATKDNEDNEIEYGDGGNPKRWEPIDNWGYDERPDEKMHTEDTYETSEVVFWDYICVLMRGKDKLTVAEWANNDEAAVAGTTANEDLEGMSDSGFAIGNTNQGERKIDTYYETFSMEFDSDESGDYETTVVTSKKAKCLKCDYTEGPCYDTQFYELSSPLSTNVIVRIETYSGNPKGGYLEDTYNSSEKIMGLTGMPNFASSSKNTVSGRMIQAEQISFLPYVLMKYQTRFSGIGGYPDTLTDTTSGWLRAHVLGRFYRSIQPNNYAEISWDKQSGSNMELFSNQWSTHATPAQDIYNITDKKEFGTNNVLPGGATLGLRIPTGNRQKVYVTTYYTATVGYGRDQCINTEGNEGEMTEEMAQEYHEALAMEITDSLNNTMVQQWQSDYTSDNTAWQNGQRVYRECDLSGLKTGNNKASSEWKYYFGNKYGAPSEYGGETEAGELGSNKGEYDADVKINTKYKAYTVYANESGEIHCADTTGSPGIFDAGNGIGGGDTSGDSVMQALDERTGVVTKLRAAVEQSTEGDDRREGNTHSMFCTDETALNGEQWYNEAFDGITIFVEESEITVFYNYNI